MSHISTPKDPEMRQGPLKKILTGPGVCAPRVTNSCYVISCIVSRRPASAAESYRMYSHKIPRNPSVLFIPRQDDEG